MQSICFQYAQEVKLFIENNHFTSTISFKMCKWHMWIFMHLFYFAFCFSVIFWIQRKKKELER